MSIDLRIVDDPLAACAAEITAALRSGGPIVLTGGSTVAAYKLAAEKPADWSGAQLWFGDERCVPVSDQRSNYGAVAAALLGPLAANGVTIDYCERMRGEDGFEDGAAAYEQVLHERGVVESGFGLLLLGLGPDTHIASMFPGQASLDQRTRLVVGVPEAGHDPFVPRITLTYPGLALARKVVVMAAGAAKADAVAAAFAQDAPATREVPASLLSEYCDNVLVLLDEEGASRL